MIANITINGPEKIAEGDLAGMYTCQIYLPDQKETTPPLYADNPDEVLVNANKFIEVYLGKKISRLENLLNEKDIRQKLTEELKWAKQELARHKQEKK